jgi:hypothetical protein
MDTMRTHCTLAVDSSRLWSLAFSVAAISTPTHLLCVCALVYEWLFAMLGFYTWSVALSELPHACMHMCALTCEASRACAHDIFTHTLACADIHTGART